MKTRIRASMARTGGDLGLALRRALTEGLARQLEQGTAGQTPDVPVPGDGLASSDGGRSVGRAEDASVGKARSDVRESERRP